MSTFNFNLETFFLIWVFNFQGNPFICKEMELSFFYKVSNCKTLKFLASTQKKPTLKFDFYIFWVNYV